ncbi:MAG: DUF397 domain-containing protein [Streptomyces sp.]|uniref:DUF397 domain-containing protein n=1 Tax=Streptomyces sp. TaxID=1931 RepID=UPI003D6BBD40
MTESHQWQKSSFSGAAGENCVEVARTAPAVQLRESDDPRTVITTTPARLAALIGAVKGGAVADLAATRERNCHG